MVSSPSQILTLVHKRISLHGWLLIRLSIARTRYTTHWWESVSCVLWRVLCAAKRFLHCRFRVLCSRGRGRDDVLSVEFNPLSVSHNGVFKAIDFARCGQGSRCAQGMWTAVRVTMRFLCSSDPPISSTTQLRHCIALPTMIKYPKFYHRSVTRSVPASKIMYLLAQPRTLLNHGSKGMRLLRTAFSACLGGHNRWLDTNLVAFGDSSNSRWTKKILYCNLY